MSDQRSGGGGGGLGAGTLFSDNLAMETPAIFINQFQVLVAGQTVRIAFAEGFAGQSPSYRSAVAMSVEDARTLANTILANLPPSPPQGVLGGLEALSAADRRYGR
ncbi:MAG TPA: hypothetical protein VN805_14245 [Caulobacteraceae bacterium]|nr:hypothetical protein [Caulobacteraceae bacterium]